MVVAIPIKGAETPLVLELLKDVSNSMIFDLSTVEGKQKLNTFQELSEMIIKDKLTSLYNRRYADERLPEDLLNASAHDYPISVMFIDIDDFKHINDKYGHRVGDAALKELANHLNSMIRLKIDWVCRYGGDEFLICLNYADSTTAEGIAERIRSNLEKTVIWADGEQIQLTISIGVHTTMKEQLKASEIVQIADQNMYKSKSSGKNRITIT